MFDAVASTRSVRAALHRLQRLSFVKSSVEAESSATLNYGDLLDKFESLGDNCEFGGIQRAEGIHHLSLFKWYATSIPLLVEMLDAGLDGVDDPRHLSLSLEEGSNGVPAEMILHHARLRSHTHTFNNISQISPAALLEREANRLRVMRRKFLEDAAAAKRIYVFRSLAPVSDAAAIQLLQALRRHGPNRLLLVRLADAAMAPGEARQLQPGLVVGALDALADYHDGLTVRTDFWPVLMKRAYELFKTPAQPRAGRSRMAA